MGGAELGWGPQVLGYLRGEEYGRLSRCFKRLRRPGFWEFGMLEK